MNREQMTEEMRIEERELGTGEEVRGGRGKESYINERQIREAEQEKV